MKAVILEGSLKQGDEADESRTLALSRRFGRAMQEHGVQVAIVRLAQLDPPLEKGPPPWGRVKQAIVDRVLAADIVVFATPIWWNNHSSLIQRVIEYLDDVNDQDIEQAGEKTDGRIKFLSRTSFRGKVAGALVVGAEDGTQHVMGNLLNFASWVGFTIPPMAGVTWTTTPDEQVNEMVSLGARNMVALAEKLQASEERR